MNKDHEKWEAECENIRKENKLLLDKFKIWLKEKGLKNATIQSHAGNVDFYINDFLLYYDICEAKDGADSIGMFLGDWFIRKATWASEAEIKSNAASLKKFYTFLLEEGDIEAKDLSGMKRIIKEEMPQWLKTMGREWGNIY